jgi:hypothetical protein
MKAKRQYIFDAEQHFEIEEEIVQYASWVAELIYKRTRNNQLETNQDWSALENKKQGFMGQELFAGLLLQFKIPNVYAVPFYKNAKFMREIENKDFDFFVPSLVKEKRYISVKTVPEGKEKRRVIIKKALWGHEKHDIMVAIKIDSVKDKVAHIAGWLYAHEVETLPTNDFGFGESYWTYLNAMDVKNNKSIENSGVASSKLMILRKAKDIVEDMKNVAWALT